MFAVVFFILITSLFSVLANSYIPVIYIIYESDFYVYELYNVHSICPLFPFQFNNMFMSLNNTLSLCLLLFGILRVK